ncbi:hypothetical protein [Mycolicibacterium vaccae]|uniref:hypothetical protein n=1 Tax=Mycolicibacterium vaccae TaxID=1810 RepID=UPI003D06407C
MTNQKCESCQGPSDLYLCGRCVSDLRELLTSLVSCGTRTDQILQTIKVDDDLSELRMVNRTRKLAGLLEHLRSYAVGQARRGEQARRTHHTPTALHGDDTLASHISPLIGCDCPEGECTCPLDKSRDRREHQALNRALAAGGVNTAASQLLAEMHYALGTWAKGIAKTHGITLDWKTTTGFAHFLSQNVPKIALDEDAGHFHHRVRAFVRRAEKIINPPEPHRACGPCPTPVEKDHGRTLCATPLTAERAATEVTCPACKETYRVGDLIQRLWDDVDEWHLTRREILLVAEVLEHTVSVDTFKTWCHRGKKIGDPPVLQRLHPRGYRRPGEAVGEWHAFRNSPGDKPVYRLIDLRKFMTDKGAKASA